MDDAVQTLKSLANVLLMQLPDGVPKSANSMLEITPPDVSPCPFPHCKMRGLGSSMCSACTSHVRRDPPGGTNGTYGQALRLANQFTYVKCTT